MLTQQQGQQAWKKPHNDDVCNLYSSPNIMARKLPAKKDEKN
jgi:hypothetical protein